MTLGKAGCSVLLIQINGESLHEEISPDIVPQFPRPIKNILFEAGGPWQAQELTKKLSENGVQPQDIDLLVCSHGHSDHVGCLCVFPEGK